MNTQWCAGKWLNNVKTDIYLAHAIINFMLSFVGLGKNEAFSPFVQMIILGMGCTGQWENDLDDHFWMDFNPYK